MLLLLCGFLLRTCNSCNSIFGEAVVSVCTSLQRKPLLCCKASELAHAIHIIACRFLRDRVLFQKRLPLKPGNGCGLNDEGLSPFGPASFRPILQSRPHSWCVLLVCGKSLASPHCEGPDSCLSLDILKSSMPSFAFPCSLLEPELLPLRRPDDRPRSIHWESSGN